MLWSCREDLVLSAGSEAATRRVEFGAPDWASVAVDFRACSVQECEDVLCIGDDSAVAENILVKLTGDAVGVAEGKVDEAKVESEFEKNGDFELIEPHFGIAREV